MPRTTGSPPPSLAQSDLASIERLIASGKPLVALQEISTARRTGIGIPSARLEDLSARAGTKIKEQFADSIKSGDFGSAYTLFTSAEEIGPDFFPGWSEGKILLSLAEEYRKKNMLIPSLLYFDKALGKGADVEKLVGSYGELALSEGDRPVIADISSYLEKAKMKVSDAYTALLNAKVTTAEMLKGVVTIWVNQGIKIDNGVGYPARVIGSGFFIDKEGYLITNYHVIQSQVDPKYEGYSRLFIRLSDSEHTRIPAKVVGYDRVFDIALLKTEVKPNYIFSFNDTDNFLPGQRVYAIGSPGGLENTITYGIISATGRRFLQMGDAMQVDVPVNPGNSGGPLVNEQAQLVGVVFAGIEQFQGVNFAIPAHWVATLIPALYRGGEIHHSWMGMAMQETDTGLEVIYVLPGSPAARAGLREGDMLGTVDDVKYKSVLDVQQRLLSLPIDSLVHLSWTRGPTAMSGLLSLGERPFAPIEAAVQKDSRESLFGVLFGMDVEETGRFLWQANYRITKVYPGSTADETGLSVGDPITVTGWKVNLEKDYAILQFSVKKKTEGFLESVVQVAAGLLINNFI